MVNNISLDNYEIFKEVYENRNLTKTSQKLHIAQPSISYRIKVLEESLNIKLFERTSVGMEPTYYADELYNNLKIALDTIKNVERDILEKNLKNKGHIYIGVQNHIGKYFLTNIIKKYNLMNPNIIIHIQNKSTNELVEMLEQGKLDFIIDSLPINSSKYELVIEDITTFNTCFAKMKNAPDNFILPVVGSTLRTRLESELQENGITLVPSLEVYTTEMIIEMVKEKIGIGYTIKEFLEHDIQNDIEYIDILKELPQVKVCVAYVKKNQPHSVRQFIELLKNKDEINDNIC